MFLFIQYIGPGCELNMVAPCQDILKVMTRPQKVTGNKSTTHACLIFNCNNIGYHIIFRFWSKLLLRQSLIMFQGSTGEVRSLLSRSTSLTRIPDFRNTSTSRRLISKTSSTCSIRTEKSNWSMQLANKLANSFVQFFNFCWNSK
jgi:hypothetical protein